MNLSLNAIKRRRRFAHRFVRRDEGEATGFQPATDGRDTLESRAVRERVNTAIRRLKPNHQAVVVLRMIEGYSTRETAEILGIPQGTVLSRLARGLEALKPMLMQDGVHDEV